MTPGKREGDKEKEARDEHAHRPDQQQGIPDQPYGRQTHGGQKYGETGAAGQHLEDDEDVTDVEER